MKKIFNLKEKIFADKLNKEGIAFIPRPVKFDFPDGTSYAPDFYLIDEKLFIEIVGNRQTKWNHKKDFENLAKFYPQINLKVEKVEYDLKKGPRKRCYVYRNFVKIIRKALLSLPDEFFTKELARACRISHKIFFQYFTKRYKIPAHKWDNINPHGYYLFIKNEVEEWCKNYDTYKS